MGLRQCRSKLLAQSAIPNKTSASTGDPRFNCVAQIPQTSVVGRIGSGDQNGSRLTWSLQNSAGPVPYLAKAPWCARASRHLQSIAAVEPLTPQTALIVPRAPGAPRSEIKREAEGRRTFADGSTRCPVHSPRMKEAHRSREKIQRNASTRSSTIRSPPNFSTPCVSSASTACAMPWLEDDCWAMSL